MQLYREDQLGEQVAALWITYDFANSVGDKNIFQNALDFNEDGGELIFDLPNGLHGYMLLDAAGNRLDAAPQAIVFDPDSEDGAVRSGASCMGCHDSEGIIPKNDEVRAYAELNLDLAERNQLLRLYPDRSTMRSLQTGDSNRFLAARQRATDVAPGSNPIVRTRLFYEATVGRADAAAVLGISVEAFEEALIDEDLAPEILALRQGLGTIQRETLEDIFADLVRQIGLGDPIN